MLVPSEKFQVLGADKFAKFTEHRVNEFIES
jgi:hypothetical protein